MKRRTVLAVTAALSLAVVPAALRADQDSPESISWIERSNANAQVLLEVMARFGPEGAARLGVDGLDEQIFDLQPDIYQRVQSAVENARAELERRLAGETDRLVRQDLAILVKACDDYLLSSRLEHENMIPYFNMSRTIFQGVRGLIDPQIPPDRYPAAVVRLKKYAGLIEGLKPMTELAKDRSRERFEVEGLIGPFRGEVEQDLERSEKFISGIRELLEGTELEGWQQPYEAIADQLEDYNDWVRAEILPRARDDFRLPPAMYEDALHNWGVDSSPQELIETATRGFMDIRNEMMALAPLVAAERGWDLEDYREVLARLKEERIDGDKILDHYRNRLTDIEKIIVEQKLVTLPKRPAGIRMGTAAETAAQPAPHLDVPRLIGNTGEYPDFVLPLLERNADGSWQHNDDTYKAGSWTLTAHEARPGHELQFSSMLETGVSIARAIFAMNSANIEGWALYAEAITKPYLPLDAQLVSLQHRLIRAARMFLDPMLNLGLISPEKAKKVLTDDVVVGEGWAQHEIERYTYRMPGQATAYFYGYGKLQALRTQVELAMGESFDQHAYHDFLLAQGVLPPEVLRDAVFEDFVGRP
jgi:hypothetical protein